MDDGTVELPHPDLSIQNIDQNGLIDPLLGGCFRR